MQVFNGASAKKTLVHTWYIYPLLAGLITILWLWGFNAFHQPTKHQMLTLFFATEVRKQSFVDKIMKKYNKEDLRQVDVFYSLPSAPGYNKKMQLYVSQSDLLILDEGTLNDL